MIDDSWAAVMATPKAPWNKPRLGLATDWPRPLWHVFISYPSVRLYRRARNLLINLHKLRISGFNRFNIPKPPLPRSQYRALACRAFAAHGLTPEDVKCYLSNPYYSHLDKPHEDKSSANFQNLHVAGHEGDNEDATSQKEDDLTLKKAHAGVSKKKRVSLASKSTNIGNTKMHDTKGKTAHFGNTKNRETEGKILPVVLEKGAREYKPCMDAFRSKIKGKRPKLLEYNCKSMTKKARRSYEDLKPYKSKPNEDNKDECPSNDRDMRVAKDDSDNENDTSDMVSCFRILTRGIEGDVSCFSHADSGNNVKLKTHVRQNKH